jgi:hypothetical protein
VLVILLRTERLASLVDGTPAYAQCVKLIARDIEDNAMMTPEDDCTDAEKIAVMHVCGACRRAACATQPRRTAARCASRPPRLCVQTAALARALFGGTADGRAHDHGADRARNLGADRSSARKRVTTIAQLVEKTGIDPRAAAAASREGEPQMLRSPLPHAPARAHGAAAPTPHVAGVPLACGPPKPRPPARLPPPPAAWLGARQGCRRSGLRDRCLRACGLGLALRW